MSVAAWPTYTNFRRRYCNCPEAACSPLSTLSGVLKNLQSPTTRNCGQKIRHTSLKNSLDFMILADDLLERCCRHLFFYRSSAWCPGLHIHCRDQPLISGCTGFETIHGEPTNICDSSLAIILFKYPRSPWTSSICDSSSYSLPVSC